MLKIIRNISTCYKNVAKNDATVNLPHWNFSLRDISLIAIFKSWHLCTCQGLGKLTVFVYPVNVN